MSEIEQGSITSELALVKGLFKPYAYAVWRKSIGRYYSKGGESFIELWLSQVRANPTNEALVFTATGESFTFQSLNDEINRLAEYFRTVVGVKPKDCVAMLLENSPQFIMTWFALMKLGATTAFINTNLRSKALHHSLTISGANVVVLNAKKVIDLSQSLLTLPNLDKWRFFVFGTVEASLPSQLAIRTIETHNLSAAEPSAEFKDSVTLDDPAILIYTSGTTGLPKAAVITHNRVSLAAYVFTTFMRATPEDRMYSALPLYHSSASMIGLGPTLILGCTMVLSPKFSARAFFTDCAKHKATIAQYIGELCRFLLKTPPSDTDKQHNVRLVVGNGLRPDIWIDFKNRFGIPAICEFYASTEGNLTLTNYQTDDKVGVGAVGFTGLITRALGPKMSIVKIDPITEQPLCTPEGWCIECEPNEPGELISLIEDSHPFRAFHGYKSNAEGTRKKVLVDVFAKGDRWFRSGDLMKRDENHFYYFVDRIGDTFRWKGENVSTNEVAEALSGYPGIKEINVYGVAVPMTDGRAGMAAIVVDEAFSIDGLAAYARERLPSYAVPVFLRIMPEIETTGTMKVVKFNYREAGCNPDVVKDPIFWLSGSNATKYTPFTKSEYSHISKGKAKL